MNKNRLFIFFCLLIISSFATNRHLSKKVINKCAFLCDFVETG